MYQKNLTKSKKMVWHSLSKYIEPTTEGNCTYYSNPVEHDGKDEYVQCSNCGEVSRYFRRKLRQTDVNEVPK